MNKEKEPKPTKTKLHKGMLLFYCTCAFVLLCAFGLMIFRMMLKSQLNAKLDEIRAAGYPATLAELNDYYPAVPEDENAALLYEKAFISYNYIEKKIFEKKIIGKKLSDADKNEYARLKRKMEQFRYSIPFRNFNNYPLVLGEPLPKIVAISSRIFVDGNRKSISLLKQAVKLEKCRFFVNFKENCDAGMAIISPIITSIDLLMIVTIMNAEAGNKQQVEGNILAMLKIFQDINNMPMRSICEIKSNIQIRIISCLERSLSLIEFNNTSLRKTTDTLEIHLAEVDSSTERALVVDRIVSISYFKETFNRFQYIGTGKLYAVVNLFGIVALNKLKILDFYDICLTLDKKNINDVKPFCDDFTKQKNSLSFIQWAVKQKTISPRPMLYKNLEIKAQLKATIIGLTIERYRLKYHKLPGKLTQLVPEFIKQLPNDPFTGKPFRYVVGDIELKISEDDKSSYPESYKSKKMVDYRGNPVLCIKRPGWVVYSFGKDQDDDNGAPAQGYANGDISFRCVRIK
jgi:hypothetical protein